MRKKYSLLLPALIIMGIALAAVLWPLFRPGFFISDDGEWMVIRLSAFYQSLADGQFPVRYLGRLNNSYGYPVANFLYPGFLYIGSLFHVFGLSFLDAVKAILGLSVIGGAVAVFMALRSKFRIIPSMMGTLSFIFSPYLLYDIYHRGSVGEVLAVFAGALIFLALEKGWVWLLSPSVALLIVSHNTVALIVGLAVFVLVAIHKFRIRMGIGAAIGTGAAAFFWIPALLEKGLVRFDATVISDPARYFIGMQNAVLLGFSTVIALAVLLSVGKKYSSKETAIAVFTVIGILMSVAVSVPVWRLSIVGQLVQFPYRFLVLPVLFGPWIVAMALERLKGWHTVVLGIIFALIWIQGAGNELQRISFVNRNTGYYTTNEATTNVANEYMPKWVTDIPLSRPVETLEVIDGDVSVATRTFSGVNIKVNLEANTESIMQINKIYYPGWGVTIDGRLTPVNYRNELGVMRIRVPQGRHTLEASFRETPMRFAADVVSLCCTIVYLVWLRKLNTMI
jgi:hypothetical protein